MVDETISTLIAVPDGAAIGCTALAAGTERPVILVRKGEQLAGFLNSCPHAGVRLDWRPNDFFDLSGTYLQCSTHGALFEPISGRCIAGPCVGARLVPLKLSVDGAGHVTVLDVERIPSSARSRR